MKDKTKLLLGDNIENLKKLPDNCIDSIVTDPPYGLKFMSKRWDHDVPSIEFWEEAIRVLKPGGHLLSFGGTRTYHRMVVNIEDAGFEIRDQIQWIYGSGFPKSHNIGKAIDKKNGVEGDKGKLKRGGEALTYDSKDYGDIGWDATKRNPYTYISKNKWDGFGTALKPSNEPICLARKPLSEKTIADNVLKWGTGGINIDGCRVGDEKIKRNNALVNNDEFRYSWNNGKSKVKEDYIPDETPGRFPANIILECTCDNVIKGDKGEIVDSGGPRNQTGLTHEWGYKEIVRTNFTDKGDIHTDPNCPCRLLDEQSGNSKSRNKYPELEKQNMPMNYYGGEKEKHIPGKEQSKKGFTDKGGASRYFKQIKADRFYYTAKVSKKERNLGLDEFEDKVIEGRDEGQDKRSVAHKKRPTPGKNDHPTVKPIKLMAYLCRLITPPGGLVLDPFMGSGSTGVAALLEGFRFCGMELDENYMKIAEARIKSYKEYE